MSKKLEGQVAVVAGPSKGIGATIAEYLAAAAIGAQGDSLTIQPNLEGARS